MRFSGTQRLVFAATVMAAAAAGDVRGQIPTEFRNLKVLPADISRDSLVQLMRSFSFATGFRCEDCHVMGPNNSMQGARYDLDEKENKLKARYMLQMVNQLNQQVLPDLPGRSASGLKVECKTCHRGLAKPHLLRTELRQVLLEQGVAAAVQRYRTLRERAALAGAYDFGQWEINELARQLASENQIAGAIAFLELNEEFYPQSGSIPSVLGGLYERESRRDDAIAAYRRALERNPQDANARARLQALTGG